MMMIFKRFFICVCSVVALFVTPWAVACQAPLYMEFYRQEYGVCCHILLQGIFPTQGSNPCHLYPLHHLRSLIQK